MDTVTRLKTSPLFAALAPAYLTRVAQIATKRFYPKDSILCRQDEYGATLYVIDSGEAILRQTDLRGLERPIGVLKAGQSFGDDALLLGNADGASVQAITPVEVVCIRKAEFDLLRQELPHIDKQLRVPSLIKEQLRTRALPGQDKEEPWLLRRRRHWFSFVRRLPLPFLSALLSFLVALALYSLGFDIGLPLLVLFVGAIPLAMVAWFVVDWLNDYYLVTTKRVLYREKVILLAENVDGAPLDKIQQTNIVETTLGNLLGFGTLQIATAASAKGTMAWSYLRDPEGMKTVIDQQVKSLRSRSLQARLHTNREEARQELLQQTGRAAPAEQEPIAPPPSTEPQKRRGILGRLLPLPALLQERYQEGNQITWRKHWLFLLKRIYLALPAFLLVSAAILVAGLSAELAPYRPSLLLAGLVLWIATFFWLWWQWEDYRNDVYILTDSKIIDVEKKPLFFPAQKREANLDKIQNITVNMPSVLGNILNFGDVEIETAGPSGSFTFDGVSHPERVQREIFQGMDEYKEAQQRQEREQRKAELSTWFQEYDKILRTPGQPPSGG